MISDTDTFSPTRCQHQKARGRGGDLPPSKDFIANLTWRVVAIPFRNNRTRAAGARTALWFTAEKLFQACLVGLQGHSELQDEH